MVRGGCALPSLGNKQVKRGAGVVWVPVDEINFGSGLSERRPLGRLQEAGHAQEGDGHTRVREHQTDISQVGDWKIILGLVLPDRPLSTVGSESRREMG